MLDDRIPMMPETSLRSLIQRFSLILQQPPLLADVFWPV